MSEVKKPSLEEELARQDELIEQNPNVVKLGQLSQDIDKYVEVREKIQNGEWLNADELSDLGLDQSFIDDYISTHELFEDEMEKTPEQISAEYVAKQNELLEKQNKKIAEQIQEREVARRVKELSEKLYRVISSFEEDFINDPAHDYLKAICKLYPKNKLAKEFLSFNEKFPLHPNAELYEEGILECSLTTSELSKYIPEVEAELDKQIEKLHIKEESERKGQQRLKRIKSEDGE